MKLGLQPVAGFKRVTIKKSKNVFFVIADPEVYKSGETYVVIGEIKVEDQSALGQRNAAQKYQQQRQQVQESAPLEASSKAATSTPASTSAAAEEETTVDESGVEAKDIEVVMQQANVTRGKAVKALKNNANDIVNAIMVSTAHKQIFFLFSFFFFLFLLFSLPFPHADFSVC